MKILLVWVFGVSVVVSLGLTPPKPNFGGTWTMDHGRSFGLPPDVQQTMMFTLMTNVDLSRRNEPSLRSRVEAKV